METERFKAVVSGTLINSALYLLTVFVAAVYDHNTPARDCAIAAFALTYLCYAKQASGPHSRIVDVWHVLSVISGVAAGVFLLLGGF